MSKKKKAPAKETGKTVKATVKKKPAKKEKKPKKLSRTKMICEWVINYLVENGPCGNASLCRKYADEFPDVNYDTIRVGVWKAGRLEVVGRTEKRKFIYIGDGVPEMGKVDAKVETMTAKSKPDVVEMS